MSEYEIIGVRSAYWAEQVKSPREDVIIETERVTGTTAPSKVTPNGTGSSVTLLLFRSWSGL